MKKVMSGIALLLVFALLAGMVPAEPWLDMISAKAESKAEDHPAEPATDTLEKGGWVYRVFTDGFVELLGYTDTSVRTLALPRAIDGAWVVRVGENAFANNTALSEVSIPTAISEIPDSAFPNARGLTVECYMGSAARKLANRRGFTVKNLSEYDFQPDVVDLSDIRSAQWSFSAGSLHAAAPYNRFLKPGAKLYLPPRGQYTTGIPLQVVSASGSEAVVEELAIWSTLVSYKVEDEMLYPDYSTTQVLCEGVTLVDDGRRAKGPSAKLGHKQEFEVEIKLSDHFKVTGSISYSCSGKASVDINLFEGLKSVSFSKTQTFNGSVGVVASVKGGSEGNEDEDEDGNTWTTNIKSLGDFIREDPETKKLKIMRVLLTSNGLLAAWLDLSLTISANGEVTASLDFEETTTLSWDKKTEKWTKTKQQKKKELNVTGAVELSLAFSSSIPLTIGFSFTETQVKFFDFSITFEPSAKASWNSLRPFCADATVKINISVKLDVGILGFEVAGKEVKSKLLAKAKVFSGTILDLDIPLWERHGEVSDAPGRIDITKWTWMDPDDCTHQVEDGLIKVSYIGGKWDGSWWKEHTWIVQNVEEDTVTTQVVKQGAKLHKPEDPQRKGYLFGGWYTDESFTTQWDFDNDVTPTHLKEMSLYAKFDPDPNSPSSSNPGDPGASTGSSAAPAPITAFTYTEGSSSVTLNKFIGPSTGATLVVPGTYNGKAVELAEGALSDPTAMAGVTRVEFSEGIQKIGSNVLGLYWRDRAEQVTSVKLPSTLKTWNNSFSSCTTLTSAELVDGITKVADEAFAGCWNLSSVSLPSQLLEVGVRAFSQCSALDSVDFPDSLKRIGDMAFATCSSLTEVKLPAGLVSLGKNAFSSCTSLTKINHPAALQTADSFRNCTELTTVTVDYGTTKIGDYFLYGASNVTEVDLPSTVTEIGNYAFYGTSITRIDLPNGIIRIGNAAFQGTGLTHIEVPAALQAVGYSAFKGTELDSFEPKGALEKIGDQAFQGTNIASLDFQLGSEIGSEAFEGCENLTSVKISGFDDYYSEIDDRAFANCQRLTTVVLPAKMSRIGDGAFANDVALTSCTIPDGLGYGSGASTSPWVNCPNLRKLVYPGSNIELYGLFGGSGDERMSPNTEIELEDGRLHQIMSSACQGGAMRSITIPTTVGYIYECAFKDCDNLTEITFKRKNAVIKDDAFDGCSAVTTIRCPQGGTVEAYFREKFPDAEIIYTEDQSLYALQYRMHPRHSLIFMDQFYHAGDHILPPDFGEYEGSIVFKGASDVANLGGHIWNYVNDTMPEDDLELIIAWDYADESESTGNSLYDYHLDDEGRLIIDGYNGYDSYLKIPDTIDGIPVYGLGEDCIPEGVYTVTVSQYIGFIDSGAFREASDLYWVNFTDEYWDDYEYDNVRYRTGDEIRYTCEDGAVIEDGTRLIALLRNAYLEDFTVPDGVTTVAPYAFSGLTYLAQVSLPASVTTLEDYAISDCEKLSNITFEAIPQNLAPTCLLGGAADTAVYGPMDGGSLEKYCKDHGLHYNLYAIEIMKDEEPIALAYTQAGSHIGIVLDSLDGVKQFKGYAKDPEGTELWDDAVDVMPCEDITLYAQWGYDFHYIPVYGGMELDRYIGSQTEIRVPDDIDGVPVVSIADDCFETAPEMLLVNQGSVGMAFAQSEGFPFIVLQWQLIYETNGGSQPVGDVETYAMGEVPELFPSVRTGYNLTGWYTDADLSEPWNAGTPMPGNDVTIYAAWEKVDEDAPEQLFTFETTEDGLVITGFRGSKMSVNIPAAINDVPVTAIGDHAFADMDGIYAVTIPDSVTAIREGAFQYSSITGLTVSGTTAIGDYAFADCQLLYNVDLGSATSIGDYAFVGCANLLLLTLSDTLGTIGEGAFEDCALLPSLSLPDSLETLGDNAFSGCRRLRSVSLGAGLAEIGLNAFSGCDRLEGFDVAAGNLYYAAQDGVLYSKDISKLIAYPAVKSETVYTIPDTVVALEDRAMQSANVGRLTVGAGLTAIASGAFANCFSLTELTFTEDSALHSIAANAFHGSTSLKSVTLPEDVVAIAADAFAGTQLTDITIPAGAVLGAGAIPASNRTTIYGYAGSDAQRYAGEYGMRFVALGETIEVESIALSKTEMKLYKGEALQLAARLTPANTTERNVVWASTDSKVLTVSGDGLVTTHSAGTATVIGAAVNGSTATCQITVTAPSLRLSALRLHLELGEEQALTADTDEAVEFTSSNESVAVYRGGKVVATGKGSAVIRAISARGLTASCEVTVKPHFEFRLPDRLLAIETEAFRGLPLVSVLLPDSLQSIGAYAFADCSRLEMICIPESVTDIDPHAFDGCPATMVILGTAGSAAARFATGRFQFESLDQN